MHVYGYPCKIDDIEKIATTHGLKVIYDAAHTFGARFNGNSLCNFGHLSILSFHATKVFNTFEGGAIVCHDADMKVRIDHLKNFGFDGEINVIAPGINGKMNEFQAALGLLQLKYIDKNIKARRKILELYQENLTGIKGIQIPCSVDGLTSNYAYYPILVMEAEYGISRDMLYNKLKKNNIFTQVFLPADQQFSNV